MVGKGGKTDSARRDVRGVRGGESSPIYFCILD